jgi:hypothetical protein
MTRQDLLAGGVGAGAMAIVLLLALAPWLGGGAGPSRAAAAQDAGSAAGATMTHSAGDDDAWRTANANLARAVELTQERLDRNEAEKRALEKELEAAKAKLSASERDGAPPRNEFDLTLDDWKRLAREGTVKATYPCRFDPDWHLSDAQVTALGLSPADAATLEAAYMNEMDRLAGVIRSGCAKALGNAELARRLGTEVCAAVDAESVKDSHADLQLVADIRAGNVAMPAPEKLDPLAAMLLAQTGAMLDLQADLATTFGAEEAHRLAFADELGACKGTWAGR